jgi:hypothetical protein
MKEVNVDIAQSSAARRPDPTHREAAERIVNIQTRLARSRDLDAEKRERLLSEQRTIWEAIFPEMSFDQIAGTAH